MEGFSLEEVKRAQEIVYQHVKPTPQYAWPQLCEAAGCEFWLKHENHTPIGAFKVRGGLVYMNAVARDPSIGDLVTATRGNHGQSIPYAARLHNKIVHVYAPESNSLEKNVAMRAWGARLHLEGPDFESAVAAAESHADKDNLHMVPSFHRDLVLGVATYGYELMTEVDGLDAIYVPVGLGSGATSLIAIRDMLGVATKIIGVVSTEADAIAQSFSAGEIIATKSAQTFADGVATRVPHPEAFEVLRTGLNRVVTVSDDEVAEAIRLIYAMTHNIAEGAGAAATAAVMQERDRCQGKRVAAILTGGNIDRDWLIKILDGKTPEL